MNMKELSDKIKKKKKEGPSADMHAGSRFSLSTFSNGKPKVLPLDFSQNPSFWF